jgi:hypothetical protein
MNFRSLFPEKTPAWVKKVQESPTTVKVILGAIIVVIVALNIAFFLKEIIKNPPEPPEA